MRVLLVNDYAIDDGYGAEAYVRRLADGLRAAGDEVSMFAGVVHHSGAGRWRDLWDPSAQRLLSRQLRESPVDVIHFHNVVRECSGSVLAATELPAVMTVHDHRLLGVPDQRRRDVASRISRTGARAGAAIAARVARERLTATMAVSDELAESLRRKGFPAVTTVAVPVDEPVEAPRPVLDCHDVAFVGRLSADKGPDIALAAFAMIARAQPGSRLLMAGDGPLREPLEKAAADAGLADRVTLLGRISPDDVSRLIGAVRCVVVPSVPGERLEGSPTVVGEAAMHGRPLIASDDPGLKSSATRLGGALIVPALSVEALAAAMTTLLTDELQAATLGAAARAAVTMRHGIPVVTESVRSIYRVARGEPS